MRSHWPIEWPFSRLKYLSSLKGRLGWQGLKADEYLDEGPHVVSSAHFSAEIVEWHKCPRVSEKRYETDSNIQLRKHDILLMKDGAALGKLAFIDDMPGPACLNSHLLLLRPTRGAYFPRFLFYLATTAIFQDYMQVYGTGATFMGVSQRDIGNFPLAIPLVAEQTQIAKFLDYETAKIDALIEKQQQLIALLKEKRQAVISHAVTKGLNPDAPMRDSGVEWLGEMPAHWPVGKCAFYLKILSGYAFPSAGFSDDTDDMRLLRGINVGVGRIRWDSTARWRRLPGDGLDSFQLSTGDLVIGMDRPVISAGVRVSLIGADDVPALLLQRVVSIKPGNLLSSKYLFLLLASDMFDAHFSPETTGVSVPHISPAQIGNFVIPVPPLEEQANIVEEVERQTRKMDALLASSNQAIELLQERRTALISAAVTGKIDVRNWTPPESNTDAEVA